MNLNELRPNRHPSGRDPLNQAEFDLFRGEQVEMVVAFDEPKFILNDCEVYMYIRECLKNSEVIDTPSTEDGRIVLGNLVDDGSEEDGKDFSTADADEYSACVIKIPSSQTINFSKPRYTFDLVALQKTNNARLALLSGYLNFRRNLTDDPKTIEKDDSVYDFQSTLDYGEWIPS